jgi:hypothetical protein
MQSLAVALVMLWKRDIRRSSSEVSLISVISQRPYNEAGCKKQWRQQQQIIFIAQFISHSTFVLLVLFF